MEHVWERAQMQEQEWECERGQEPKLDEDILYKSVKKQNLKQAPKQFPRDVQQGRKPSAQRTWTTQAELFYLNHLRTLASSAWGARGDKMNEALPTSTLEDDTPLPEQSLTGRLSSALLRLQTFLLATALCWLPPVAEKKRENKTK